MELPRSFDESAEFLASLLSPRKNTSGILGNSVITNFSTNRNLKCYGNRMHASPLRNPKALVYLAIGVLLVSISVTESSNAQYTPEGILGVQIDAGDENKNIRPTTHIARHGAGTSILCDGVNDLRCPKETSIGATANLQPCSEKITLGCVINLYAVNGSGKRTDAQFIRIIDQYDKKNDYSEQIDRNLVAGAGVGSVWKIPGVTHGGGSDTYVLNAFLVGSSNYEGDFSYDNFQFDITATTELRGNFSARGFVLGADGSIAGMGKMGPGLSCQSSIAEDGQGCFTRNSMPKDTRLGVEVFLPNALSGWFHGRIFKPQITVDKINAQKIRYEMEAEPVTVPILNEVRPQSSLSSNFKQFVNSRWGTLAHTGQQLMPGSSGDIAFEVASLYLPMIGDKASSSGDFWSVKSQGTNGAEPNVADCSKDKSVVSGIVTTNAMVYTASPPSFNKQNQSLDYRILSPHLNETGKENLGSYDLLINAKVARCVYGFSNAPVRAEIQVFGSDGTSKVATTVLGEKGDWIFLSANGFTYSEPVVRVKLTQEVEVVVVPTPTPTPAPSASSKPVSAKKTTITCVKGKTNKKVTAVKPKCPKGFKKR